MNRKIFSARFYLLVVFFLSVHVYADNINLSHLTVKEGLLNSTVYFAMQDAKGFMWFCTETGVSRYDGQKFEHFTINDGLADNVIFKCFEDSKHRVWFLSYNGRLSFYQNGKIYNSENTPYLSYPVTGAFLLQCIEDKWGNIWFSTSLSSVIKVSDNGVTQYRPPYPDRNYSDFYISYVLFKENDSVKKFVVDPHTQNLFIQNLTSGQISNAGKFPGIYQQNKKTVSKNFCNANSKIFINENDLISYDGRGQWQVFDLKKYGIKSALLSFLNDGQYLWLATDEQGVYKIDLATGDLALNLLKEELVTKITRDNENNYWFVTHDNGVFVLKNNTQLFNTINTQTTYSVCSIEYDHKHCLVSGNNNGMIYIISNGQVQSSFSLSDRRFNRVLDIISVGGSKIAIGCDLGIFEYDVRSGKKTDCTYYLNGYKNYNTAPDGSVWFCSPDRIVKLSNNEFSGIKVQPKLVKYTAIAVVSDSVYYLGTTNKLYKVFNNGEQFGIILNDDILKTQVAGLKIVNGFLWVATHGNGIFILKDDKIVRHINKAACGIVSDICQRLYDDGKNLVWVATNEGVSAINRYDFKLVSNINSDIGIASNDIKNIATANDTVYAATSAGTCIFKLSEVQFESNPPAVYITGYKKGNETVLDPPGKIEFNYFKGSVTVSFTAITFQAAQNLQYEYKFSEESDWHRTPVTDIPFFSLSPGTHSLMFRAKKYNSNWSKPVLLSIIVDPAWYQTIWFRIVVGLIIFFSIFYQIQLRLKRIRKKAKEENDYHQRITELESKALILQMNPHFIFNSLNTVQQLILVKEEQQSLDYLSDFSMLMRRMLENSRKQLITLREEIDFLKSYLQLEAIRFNNKFEYSISVDEKLVLDEIKIPPVLLQPLLENAIKHGISSVDTNGLVKLSVYKENDLLVAVVEDNGAGIYSQKETAASHFIKKESTALKVLEERLKLIKNNKGEGSSIKIVDKGLEDGPGTGTLIELRIPILV